MKQTEYSLEQSYRIQADKLFQFLVKVENHKLFHPYIINITGKQIVSNSFEYHITDKIKFLSIFSYKHSYTAKQTVFPEKNMFTFTVNEIGNTKIKTVFQVFEQAHASQLVFTAHIQAPAWLINYIRKSANKAHTQFLANLKNYLSENIL